MPITSETAREAAAGHGKSVLGAELVEVWGSVGVEALLEEGGVSAELLAARWTLQDLEETLVA